MLNQRVTFFTDNEALVYVIYENSCREYSFLMTFERRLALVCLQNNKKLKSFFFFVESLSNNFLSKQSKP